MKNEIKNRKKRFWAAMLVLLLLLNQIPPSSADAAETYTVDAVYEGQVLSPNDTISNSTEVSCMVYYYDETGGELSSATVNRDAAHTVPAYTATVADGFQFVGWKVYAISAISGGVESISLKAVVAIDGTEIGDSLSGGVLNAGTVIYHATDTYTITYFDQDGTTQLGETGTITANVPYTVAGYSGTVPTGQRFTSWQVSYVYSSGGSGSIELTAQFEAVQYTITFDTAGGSEVASITQAYDTAVTAPESPTKTGYTFAGWDVEIPTTMPAENITITAQWTANKYTVKFVNEDGTELQSSEVAYGEIPTYSGATPTKAGDAQYTYTFSGWTPVIANVTGDATYTAQYDQTVNSYTVTWIVDGKTTTESYEYGATPSFTGNTDKASDAQYTYTFSGWSPVIANVTGDATYTAQYDQTVNSYTVTWIVDGKTTTESYEYGATPSFTGNTDKAGDAQYTYTFSGWSPVIANVTGDATYTATYTQTANPYTITFDTDGGSLIVPITQAYGTAVTAPESPTKTGYTFAGWDVEIPTTMPAENITITAQWTANSYSIRYTLDGGANGENPDSYTYGKGVSGLEDAVKPGYSFAGWYESADFSGSKVTNIAADRTGEIMLYAKFEMVTIEAGTYSLTAGVEYTLGNVTKVSGDSSVYIPGSTFYVTVSGSYTFS